MKSQSEARDAVPATSQASGRPSKASRASNLIGVGNVIVIGVVLAAVALLLNLLLTGGIFHGASLALQRRVETSYITAIVTKTEYLPSKVETTESTLSLSAPLNSETPAQNETESSHTDSSNPDGESGHGDDDEDGVPDWLLNYEIPWGQLENYELGDKLGTFSLVFLHCKLNVADPVFQSHRRRRICRSLSSCRSSQWQRVCRQGAETNGEVSGEARDQDPPRPSRWSQHRASG